MECSERRSNVLTISLSCLAHAVPAGSSKVFWKLQAIISTLWHKWRHQWLRLLRLPSQGTQHELRVLCDVTNGTDTFLMRQARCGFPSDTTSQMPHFCTLPKIQNLQQSLALTEIFWKQKQKNQFFEDFCYFRGGISGHAKLPNWYLGFK